MLGNRFVQHPVHDSSLHGNEGSTAQDGYSWWSRGELATFVLPVKEENADKTQDKQQSKHFLIFLTYPVGVWPHTGTEMLSDQSGNTQAGSMD